MKIEYICHACLAIDTPDARIVCDPWFVGSAYAGQWNVFPKPIEVDSLKSADAILISHGHEDHLHAPTLETFDKSAQVFVPYNWYGSFRGYLGSMGFSKVTEMLTNKRHRLGPKTYITNIANNLDSIFVIESDGQVLVNVNDALHAHHPRVIELFCEQIRRRWPRIDVVFCGFGGASYFPNTIHVAGKDDESIGRLREQFFVHNFCRIVAGLKPSVAVPFAADFALLEPHKRWMNDIRFPRARIAEYFREHFAAEAPHTKIFDMYPGDVLENNKLIAKSPYRARLVDDDLKQLIPEQYGPEMAATEHPPQIDEASAERLTEEIRQNIVGRTELFPPERLANLRFAVRATDVAERPYYHVRFVEGAPRVERSDAVEPDEVIVFSVSSRILRYGFASVWGGDAITIGYAADIEIRDKKVLVQKLDTVCVRLLTRHPSASRHMMKQPFRAARFLLGNPLTRKWAIRRLRGRGGLDATYDANLWLTRTKCEVCQVCDMPLLSDQFSATL